MMGKIHTSKVPFPNQHQVKGKSLYERVQGKLSKRGVEREHTEDRF
jgi:hypothetical protein